MDKTNKTVRIRTGYFSGRVGQCLGRSMSCGRWLVKFPDNHFIFSFTEDNVEEVNESILSNGDHLISDDML